jgi:uncharacterized protein DUF6431/Homeodomain-like domain-containing protein
MIGIADVGQAETDLAAGTLACPGCARPLQPWGHARTRTVRDHGRTTLAVRPRRVRCRACRSTHVLLPAAVAPRRADTTAVIGSALLASARGTGYRRIAVDLGRPLSTVRRWIRAVRDAEHVEWLRAQAVGWLARVDRDVLADLRPEATRLGEALTALAAAAVTLRARVAPGVPAWTLIGQITHGRLVAPAAPAGPG